METQKYDFDKLEEFLNNRFPYPNDCIEVLERIEYALIHLEHLFILQPDILKAIKLFEELKICIEDSIPSEKRRI
ncbi:hypothetical protein [Cytophaga hutchinsonii]|nr:hypothetical protein [Cytophaga hutchinsonii]SFX21889.1 hypothetical protein SAMN04487930_10294 [Cytophaga hutchinsonii ATCC 33406]